MVFILLLEVKRNPNKDIYPVFMAIRNHEKRGWCVRLMRTSDTKPFNWPEACSSKTHASGESYILERGNSRHSGFKLQLVWALSQISS